MVAVAAVVQEETAIGAEEGTEAPRAGLAEDAIPRSSRRAKYACVRSRACSGWFPLRRMNA